MSKGGSRPGSGRRRRVSDPAQRARVIPVPAAPEGLSERERAIWRAHAEQVDVLEIFTISDASTFRAWCRVEALLEEALDGERTDTDAQGNEKQPSLAAIGSLARVVGSYAEKFRCTPLSRGAVPATAAPEPADEEDLDDLKPIDGPLQLATAAKTETH